MSHLSTIINRVNHRVILQDYGSLFEQAVINLMEYIEAWTDATYGEIEEAKRLFDLHEGKVKANFPVSHKQRIAHAREIRASFK